MTCLLSSSKYSVDKISLREVKTLQVYPLYVSISLRELWEQLLFIWITRKRAESLDIVIYYALEINEIKNKHYTHVFHISQNTQKFIISFYSENLPNLRHLLIQVV